MSVRTLLLLSCMHLLRLELDLGIAYIIEKERAHARSYTSRKGSAKKQRLIPVLN